MAKLEKITVGSTVKGIIGNEPVSIVAVQWYGSNVLEITYKDTRGVPGTQLLYRDSEPGIEVLSNNLPWSFDADASQMKLASEAYRISLAHLFDPYLAVHTSSVEPLPHQISAVYQEMLPKLPLRYVLADDPGAGKTIMTGLFIKELIARGDLKRCLIVSPGSLAEQWQDELYNKFHLRFEILTNDRMESAVSGNVFTEVDRCICRLDKLARNDELQEKLKVSEWDLIVCDEAHKMSATIWGGEVKYTKRFQLGRLLSNITRNFLLLTATPHNGKEDDFHLFLSLIDPDRFEGTQHSNSQQAVDVSDVMRRLVKEELLKFDGKPLFPERIAYTVNYDLSPQEAALYQAVTEYVQEEFNRADKLNNERKTTVGFALTILQRRLASSPEAIYQSLHRRIERLEHRLAEEKLGKRAAEYRNADWDDIDDDDLPPDEQEEMEEKVVDHASAAATIAELEAEIGTLKRLEKMANDVRVSGIDRKWDELSHLLQDNSAMFGEDGQREKLIIFTEHKDTLNYLTGKIRSLFGNPESVVTIHGGMLRDERRKVEQLFKQDVGVRVLIATDAAGEGINLQRAHLMINYDLPWNPNRLEQRFGRIHRIGQTEVCHLWNLVANETREGFVFQRLFAKLEEEREALGGKVFDILGKVTFDNKSLRDLLIEAVRYGNDPEVRARLNRVVDSSMDPEVFRRMIAESALTDDVMDVNVVNAIREDMERIEAHKLQPHFIESFFIEAFKSLGGKIRNREAGRYEITSVPYAIRNRDMQIGFGETVLNRYERVCFDKEFCTIQGLPQAALICPGHPLLEATIDLIREKNVDVMKRGAVFIDDSDFSEDAKLLFYIEDAVQDGVILKDGNRRTISKHIHFVEIKEDGSASSAGYAPYLDYRAATDAELAAIQSWMPSQGWLGRDVESLAKGYAIEHLIPSHFSEVKKRKEALINKTAKAVKDRLTAEIQYWDYRAGELAQKEAAGKTNAKLNSKLAARRAEELESRMQNRLADLDLERRISPMPPIITGGALVIPRGLLHKLMAVPTPGLFGHGDRQAIEYAAMNAVIQIGYADLSDFFYVWMRKSLAKIYPKSFTTLLVPKKEELVAIPYRFDGDKKVAHAFFEDGMFKTCQEITKYADEDYPVTIYYAYKQSDTQDGESVAVSSGWETMLSAIINAGLQITGTWPLSTERESRSVGIGTNALASSIVLVCKKRASDAPQTTRRNLINALRKDLRPALRKLQVSNIAPVDLAQSAIGPGMAVFSRYKRVLEADGSVMTVRSALHVINEEIDLFFNEQVGSLDTASRFCIDLYTQCAYNDIKYGEAEVLANAKGTSIPMMAAHGVLYAKAGLLHLIERDELPESVDTNERNIWMLTQQLTRAMAKGGVNACAEIIFNMFGSNAESAKDLAYRLYTIAERKGWAEEAYAYNNLVVAWPDIQTRAAELKAVQPEQMNLFDLGLLNKE